MSDCRYAAGCRRQDHFSAGRMTGHDCAQTREGELAEPLSDRRLTHADYLDDLRAWSAEMSQPLDVDHRPGADRPWPLMWATQSVLPLTGRAAYHPLWENAVTQPDSWVAATMVGLA
jgi:hypothetical protein